MTNWKNSAASREWHTIDIFRLGADERIELIKILEAALPMTQHGHGLETFEATLSPRHAESYQDFEGACLYRKLTRLEEVLAPKGETLFEGPIELAKGHLRGLGILYKGWRETFLLWDGKDQEKWRQVDSRIAKKSIAHRARQEKAIFKLPGLEAIEAYKVLVSGERVFDIPLPLSSMFRNDQIEVNTPFWHALNILNFVDYHSELMDEISRHLQWPPSPEGTDFTYISDLVTSIAGASLEIGKSWQSLYKKQYDTHVFRGIKVLKGASDGGSLRRDQNSEDTELILAKMKVLIEAERPQTVQSAAAVVFRNGKGSSVGANRALWYRHRTKEV